MLDAMESPKPVPKCLFFQHSAKTEPESLAILHLRKDLQESLLLRERDENGDGYAEGKVLNTRFGSFPHTTLLGVPWGSQVRASAVDTGSRGRRDIATERNLKRKRAESPNGTQDQADDTPLKAAVLAQSGFGHLLQPTPERWTYSLPHRTQILYTPDYSYILQRIRARPGSVLIESGAGSGSFTHAAARAVFNGDAASPLGSEAGHVWSFEFHPERVKALSEEIRDHGLDPIVTITERDVYENGFGVSSPNDATKQLVHANAVFLDLPSPWKAIPHLTRNNPQSPLDPESAIHICTFSPCIEQVQATVPVLRAHGWVDISMVDLAAKRIEVWRERVGLREEGLHGVNASAASVDEAVSRLRELEERSRLFQEDPDADLTTKQDRLRSIKDELDTRLIYKEGRLLHRSEPELKTHTSYLVFAVLPREWSDEDEKAAAAAASQLESVRRGKSKKQLKRERRQAAANSVAATKDAASTTEV